MLRAFNPHLPVSLLPPITDDKNVDTANLLHFIDRLYHPHIAESFFIQLWVCIGLVFLLSVPTSIVMLHRVVQRRAWFFKIWPVAGGTFVIPNSVMAFLSCQAVFAAAWLFYTWVTIQYYSAHSFQMSYMIFKVLVWVPLWDGGWLTAFGVLSAFPDALTLKTNNGRQKRLILSPLAFNVACWVVPFVQLASVLPHGILAARKHNQAFDGFEAWRTAVQIAQRSSISDAKFTELRTDALNLWLEVTKAYWYLSIAMTIWDVWAIFCLIVYVPVGAHTLLRIKAQLQIAKTKEQVVKPIIHVSSANSRASNAFNLEDAQRSTFHGTTTSRVYPPMKPKNETKQAQKTPNRTVEQRRTDNLQRIYKNLSVQYYGISLAILCFFASSSIYAINAYESARANDIAPIQVQGNLSAAYAIVVFGSLTVTSIFWRSFDPSLSVDISEEEPTPLAPRSILAAFKKRKSVGNLNNPIDPEQQVSSSSNRDDSATSQSPISPTLQVKHNEPGPEDRLSISVNKTSTGHLQPVDRPDCETSMDKMARSIISNMSTGSDGNCKASGDLTLGTSEALGDVYYATPFGRIPASDRGHMRDMSGVKHPIFNRTAQALASRSSHEEQDPLHNLSTSNFGQCHCNASTTSLSSVNTFAASQQTNPYGTFAVSAQSEVIEVSRSESILELAGRGSPSSGLTSSCDSDHVVQRGFPHFDMGDPCFAPPYFGEIQSHHQEERPDCGTGIERGVLDTEQTRDDGSAQSQSSSNVPAPDRAVPEKALHRP